MNLFSSLDIEGGEFQILQTIPWNKVRLAKEIAKAKGNGFSSLSTLVKFISHFIEARKLNSTEIWQNRHL